MLARAKVAGLWPLSAELDEPALNERVYGWPTPSLEGAASGPSWISSNCSGSCSRVSA